MSAFIPTILAILAVVCFLLRGKWLSRQAEDRHLDNLEAIVRSETTWRQERLARVRADEAIRRESAARQQAVSPTLADARRLEADVAEQESDLEKRR